jgi:hypothetical protein
MWLLIGGIEKIVLSLCGVINTKFVLVRVGLGAYPHKFRFECNLDRIFLHRGV